MNSRTNQRTAITNVDSSRRVYQYDSLGQIDVVFASRPAMA